MKDVKSYENPYPAYLRVFGDVRRNEIELLLLHARQFLGAAGRETLPRNKPE